MFDHQLIERIVKLETELQLPRPSYPDWVESTVTYLAGEFDGPLASPFGLSVAGMNYDEMLVEETKDLPYDDEPAAGGQDPRHGPRFYGRMAKLAK